MGNLRARCRTAQALLRVNRAGSEARGPAEAAQDIERARRKKVLLRLRQGIRPGLIR